MHSVQKVVTQNVCTQFKKESPNLVAKIITPERSQQINFTPCSTSVSGNGFAVVEEVPGGSVCVTTTRPLTLVGGGLERVGPPQRGFCILFFWLEAPEL